MFWKREISKIILKKKKEKCSAAPERLHVLLVQTHHDKGCLFARHHCAITTYPLQHKHLLSGEQGR